MTTYTKIELDGHVYEMKSNVGCMPRCWKDGKEISHAMYMSDLHDHLAKHYDIKRYTNEV